MYPIPNPIQKKANRIGSLILMILMPRGNNRVTSMASKTGGCTNLSLHRLKVLRIVGKHMVNAVEDEVQVPDQSRVRQPVF